MNKIKIFASLAMGIFVFYCFETIYHTLSSLKQYLFIKPHSFIDQKSSRFDWVFHLGSYKAKIKV